MPYKNKKSYNKFQKKAYRRRKSSYKNRQQLLSIKTVKAIAKKVVEQAPELRYYSYPTTLNLALGNPALYNGAQDPATDATIPKPRVLLLTSQNAMWDTGVGLGIHNNYSSLSHNPNVNRKQKVFLKNVNIRMEITTPWGHLVTGSTARTSSLWCNVYWYIVKTKEKPYMASNPNPIDISAFKNNWFESTGKNKQGKKDNTFTIVKKGIINCNPNTNCVLATNNPTGAVSFPYRVVKRNINVPINKTISCLGEANQLGGGEVGLQHNNNSYNYYFIAYSQQEKMGINTSDHKYINATEDSTDTSGGNAGPITRWNITLSGYGY